MGLRALRRHTCISANLEPLIAEHGGRILKFEGDSLMAIFPTLVRL